MKSNSSESVFEGRGKVYFILAIILLVTLSLIWSVDTFVACLLISAIIFFLYLTFRNIKSTAFEKSKDRWDFNQPDSDESSFENFKEKFEKRNIYNSEKPAQGWSAQQKAGLIIGTIVFFFFGLVMAVVLLSEDDSDAELYFQEGESFYDAYQYDSAQNFYRKAINEKPEYPEAITGYANTLMLKEDYDSAIIMYDKALALNPQYDKAKYQRSLVLYYQKRYDDSVDGLKILLNENPSYYSAFQLMGDNFYVRDQYDSALYWYKNAYSNDVRNRYLCHLMGYIYQTKDSTNKAIQLYQEALSYDSTVTDIYERLADLLPGRKGEWYKNKAASLKQSE